MRAEGPIDGAGPSGEERKPPAPDLEYSGLPERGLQEVAEEDLRALEGNKLTRSLFAPGARVTISGLLTLLLSVVLSFAPDHLGIVCKGAGGLIETAGLVVVLMLILVQFAYLVGGYFHDAAFERASANYRYAYNRLAQSNNAMVRVLAGQRAILTQVSEKANEAIHIIESGKEVDPMFWAFEDSCQSACESIKRALLDYCSWLGEGEIEVGYVMLDEETSRTQNIKLCAFAGGAGSTPRILGEWRNAKRDSRFDAELFREGRDGVVALLTNREVQDRFFWASGSDSSSRAKYSQFFAVPVFCNRGHMGSPKMIGLFEVGCLNGAISADRRGAEDVMKSVVSPYCNIILVIHKLHKGVHVRPPKKVQSPAANRRGRR